MADLLVWHVDGVEALVESPDFRSLRLHCWRCRAVHTVALVDVERLVAALGADAAQAWDDAHMPSGDDTPACLLEVLDRATTGDLFQFVDLTISNRQEHHG